MRGSESYRRAYHLAQQERNLIGTLVSMREKSGLSVKDIADKLGASVEAIEAFESMDSSPTLSSVMSYAHALEAMVTFQVEQD